MKKINFISKMILLLLAIHFTACSTDNGELNTVESTSPITVKTTESVNLQNSSLASSCENSISTGLLNPDETRTLATLPAGASLVEFNLNWKTLCYYISANISFNINLDNSTIEIKSFSDSEGRGISHIQFTNQYTFVTPYLSGVRFIYNPVNRTLTATSLKNGCNFSFPDENSSGAEEGIYGCWGIVPSLSESMLFSSTGCNGSYPAMTGTFIGTPGDYGNTGNYTGDKAFDGNVNTYVDAKQADGAWVGLDLGSVRNITCIRFAPRNGWANRMRGGKFQISNNAEFTNPTTIYTIPETANLSFANFHILSTVGPIPTRYVRYLSPNGGWCNVSEIDVY